MPKEKKNLLNNYVVEKRGLAELKVLCHFVIFFFNQCCLLESQLKSQCFDLGVEAMTF